MWIAGTFVFAALVNWTINARSILPMIPAVGIVLARRLDFIQPNTGSQLRSAAPQLPPSAESGRVTRGTRVSLIPLLVSGVLALWITWTDTELANSARRAAALIQDMTRNESVFFQGHWGFQYYMERGGARPDAANGRYFPGNVLVLAENNTNIVGPPAGVSAAHKVIQFPKRLFATTMDRELGAGFYTSIWGPLPFAIGPPPPERYHLFRLVSPQTQEQRPVKKLP